MRTEETQELARSSTPLPGCMDGDNLQKSTEGPKGRQKKGAPITSTALVYAKRQVIFKEEQRASAIYQVVSGAVILTRQGSGGRRDVLEVLGPGSILGIVPGAHYGCQAEAMTRTAMRRIDRSAAEKSVALQKIIAQALMQKVEKMRDETNMRIRRTATESVAALILSLPRIETAGPGDSRLALSQSDMASYLGLALETVCRTMRDLKRKGAVAMSGRDCITILDGDALARLADLDPVKDAAPEPRHAAAV